MKKNDDEESFHSFKQHDFKKICVGTQTFEYLRENDYLYVDKTKDIRNLIHNEKIVFLSRPRRFGKSLLVSTLKSLFSGNKKLFEGLYIYDHWNWDKSYPVIHLDMSKVSNKTNELLELTLASYVNKFAKDFGIELDENLPADYNFPVLIEELSNKSGKNVVILVDEYDTPILDNINNEGLVDANRRTLQSFYLGLKNSDEYIDFIFITGISKFIHTSIFSKLNNPTDISLLNDYSTICGITHEELNDYCNDHVQTFADENNITYKEVLTEISHWYDGYSFDGEHKVFNPFYSLSALKNKEFSQYWFSTGTPHFLVDILKSEDYKFSIGNNRKVDIDMALSENDLNEIDPLKIKDISLLFQGGYLTIKKNLKMKITGNCILLKFPILRWNRLMKII